jgi:phosphohistidine phosphatase SixA
MSAYTNLLTMLGCAGAATVLIAGSAQTQASDTRALIASLKRGGYMLVMRHASSPRETPDKLTANADNVRLERQLDAGGRAGAAAMGKALRDLKIPIGEVLSSPTYRALETVKLAQLPSPRVHAELGDGGQSMQGATDAQGAWLRERAMRLRKGTNTIIVTHMPNIARAFPEWGAVSDGEVVIVGPGTRESTQPLGRIEIDEWSRFR